MRIRKVMTSEISATLMKLRHPQQRILRIRRRKVRKMTTSEILATLMKLRHRQQHKLRTKRRMMKKMMTLETLMRLRLPLLSHLPYTLLQIYLDQISRPKTPTKSMVSTMSTRMQPLSRMNFCLTYSGFKIPMMMTQT